ncbi:TPA: homoprotocatechuate degradation operon regulator HpaR, partial [Klebsiella pneumoniae]|nr:homoprotocatechuate degradation operon regulator HpaR [Klebsiella pneumoniae]
IEAEFTVEKMRQLTALLEEFIALGNGTRGEEEA